MKLYERKRMLLVLGAFVMCSIFGGANGAEAAKPLKPAGPHPGKPPVVSHAKKKPLKEAVGPEKNKEKPKKDVNGSEKNKPKPEKDVIGFGEVQVSAFDMATSNYTLARSSNTNGNATGNGVRLRKYPKVTAKVLELIYNKESVCINYTKSARESNGNWYYVKRVKTGTWGWISSQYLSHWD